MDVFGANNPSAEMIDFTTVKMNKVGFYAHTQFYPNGRVLAHLNFKIEYKGAQHEINGVIVKVNDTCFSALSYGVNSY